MVSRTFRTSRKSPIVALLPLRRTPTSLVGSHFHVASYFCFTSEYFFFFITLVAVIVISPSLAIELSTVPSLCLCSRCLLILSPRHCICIIHPPKSIRFNNPPVDFLPLYNTPNVSPSTPDSTLPHPVGLPQPHPSRLRPLAHLDERTHLTTSARFHRLYLGLDQRQALPAAGGAHFRGRWHVLSGPPQAAESVGRRRTRSVYWSPDRIASVLYLLSPLFESLLEGAESSNAVFERIRPSSHDAAAISRLPGKKAASSYDSRVVGTTVTRGGGGGQGVAVGIRCQGIIFKQGGAFTPCSQTLQLQTMPRFRTR